MQRLELSLRMSVDSAGYTRQLVESALGAPFYADRAMAALYFFPAKKATAPVVCLQDWLDTDDHRATLSVKTRLESSEPVIARHEHVVAVALDRGCMARGVPPEEVEGRLQSVGLSAGPWHLQTRAKWIVDAAAPAELYVAVDEGYWLLAGDEPQVVTASCGV